MKKQLLTLTGCAFLSLGLFAQDDMKEAWTQKYDHQTERVGTGLEGDGEVSYIATDKEITVYKTSNGDVVWTNKFKELTPNLRKIDELIPFWESDAMFLFDKKIGKDKLAVINLTNGKVLWESERYQGLTNGTISYLPEKKGFLLSLTDGLVFVDAQTGEEKWETKQFIGAIGQYIYEDGDIVVINLAPSYLLSLFKAFKNQIARIDLNNGNIKWTTKYSGIAETKVITKERVYDLNRKGDKLFLELNGLQVFDFNTGATLWTATYDATPDVKRPGTVARGGSISGFTKIGVYETTAKPVRVGNDVYIVETTKKRDQKIKKYDANTGKLLWESAEIKGAKCIPNLFVKGDKVIIQIGGVVEYQGTYMGVTKDANSGTTTWTYSDRVYYENVKPNGLQAFNTKDGTMAWDTERFKKGITNSFSEGENIYVSSGKALYSIKSSDGSVNYEVDVKNGGVGNATQIRKHNDKIIVVGEKGVSAFSQADGTFKYGNKYKRSEPMKQIDNILLMVTENNDFAAFNLDDCTYVKYNAKKDSQQQLSEDGNFVWAYEKKVVTKLKTR
jgi:outer membrane protein assembly factor BamB